MEYVNRGKRSLQTDKTWEKAQTFGAKGARALPRATAEYIIEKVPIVSWLPRYNYRWLINDVIAGLTLGIMLIPQSLAYAVSTLCLSLSVIISRDIH